MKSEVIWEKLLPMDIEKRSFAMIEEELSRMEEIKNFQEEELPVLKRCIHTTADFDYAKNLVFTHDAVKKGMKAIREGATIVTDTNMAFAGINKKACEKNNCDVVCFMAHEDVALEAKKRGETRAYVSMEKAAHLSTGQKKPVIVAVGNAPTALLSLYHLIQEKRFSPALIVGVPVGFVNVTNSKELLLKLKVPSIVARGRKGGSNVAAAVINALLYMCDGRTW